MTSTFKISIPDQFHLSTRPNGAEARKAILQAMQFYDLIELDFVGQNPTPSFADECLGILCKDIGLAKFNKNIKLLNLTEHSRSLFKLVISRRLNQLQMN